MGQPPEAHIRELQEFYWSDADPDGRGFVPLADALRRSGEYREATRVLREGLGRHPDFLSAHIVAAWVSLDMGRPEEAEDHFRAALELDSRNTSALRGLAELHLDRGEADSALRFLEDLIREDPVDPSLPSQVLELREKAGFEAEAADEGQEGVPEIEMPLWDDVEEVAEELDWEVATLQPDSSEAAAPGNTPPDDETVAFGTVASGTVASEAAADETPDTGSIDETLDTGAIDETLETGVIDEIQGIGAVEELRDGDSTAQEEEPQEAEVGLPTGFSAAVVEDQEPIPGPQEFEDALLTPTLGDIYLRQGLLDKAEGVFETLLASDLDNSYLRDRLNETRKLMGASDELFDGDAATQTQDPRVDRTGDQPAEESESIEEDLPPVKNEVEVVSIESLAPDRMSPLSAGLDEPGSDGDLAPLDLAPLDPVSIDLLSPDGPISIDLLSPDGPIPIDLLAPDGPIPIDALAPDGPVGIDALAPDEPISIDFLAPDAPAGVGDGERDATIDDFERWLDNLQ